MVNRHNLICNHCEWESGRVRLNDATTHKGQLVWPVFNRFSRHTRTHARTHARTRRRTQSADYELQSLNAIFVLLTMFLYKQNDPFFYYRQKHSKNKSKEKNNSEKKWLNNCK